MLRRANLDGDRQADSRVHGGPERAVLLYGAGRYALWAAELGRPLELGAFGENLTVDGFDEDTACLGDVYRVGEAAVQLSEVRGPCYKVQYRTGVPDLIDRINATGRSGVYARVIEEGRLRAGDGIELLDRPNPGWTAARAGRAYEQRKRDPEAARPLLDLAGLSVNWRARLERQVGGS